MSELILALWGLFLITALAATLVDVYLLIRVVRFCRQIRLLTKATLPAAVGIVKNTDAEQALGRTVKLVGALVKKTSTVEELTGVVANQLVEEAR
jgi:hypothetical protein